MKYTYVHHCLTSPNFHRFYRREPVGVFYYHPDVSTRTNRKLSFSPVTAVNDDARVFVEHIRYFVVRLYVYIGV